MKLVTVVPSPPAGRHGAGAPSRGDRRRSATPRGRHQHQLAARQRRIERLEEEAIGQEARREGLPTARGSRAAPTRRSRRSRDRAPRWSPCRRSPRARASTRRACASAGSGCRPRAGTAISPQRSMPSLLSTRTIWWVSTISAPLANARITERSSTITAGAVVARARGLERADRRRARRRRKPSSGSAIPSARAARRTSGTSGRAAAPRPPSRARRPAARPPPARRRDGSAAGDPRARGRPAPPAPPAPRPGARPPPAAGASSRDQIVPLGFEPKRRARARAIARP